jgi:transcriptional regulator with XRE-family HTH domain
MGEMGDHDPQWEATARKVREELARRRMSRQALADLARISISTLEKALSGQRPFTMATLIRLEEALGAPLRQPIGSGTSGTAPAPEEMGSYSRGAVRWLEGRYVTLRPSFTGGGDAIYSYCTSIDWETERSCLCFTESERSDAGFTQHGSVSMPHLSGHIYLVTNESGQYRLAILARPTAAGSLYGILATLLAGQGSQLVPAACPIALLRMDRMEEPAFGRIETGHDLYPHYRAQLDAVTERDFARFP